MSIRNWGRNFILAVLVMISLVTAVFGQHEDDVRPTMRAVPLSNGEQISLDGILDEAVWKRAVPAKDFIQQDPDYGAAATEPTEVRIAFDSERLYMGIICFDSEPERMRGIQRRRDEFLSSDDRFM